MDDLFSTFEHEATEAEAKQAVKTFSGSYLSVFVYLVFVGLLAFFTQIGVLFIFGLHDGYYIISSPYFTYAIQVIILYILGFPILWLMNRKIPRISLERKKLGFGNFLSYFLIGIFAMQAGAYISSLLSSRLGELFPNSELETDSVQSFINDTPIWLIFLVVVVIGPIFEELMFRRILLDRLSLYGNRLAITVTSVTFGLFHGNLEQLVYATALGFVLGIVYIESGNIKYSIALHCLINLFGTFPSLLLQYFEGQLNILLDSGSESVGLTLLYSVASALLTIFILGLALAGLIIFIVRAVRGAFMPKRDCTVRLSGYTLAKCVILNLGCALFLIYSFAQIFNSGLYDALFDIFEPYLK